MVKSKSKNGGVLNKSKKKQVGDNYIQKYQTHKSAKMPKMTAATSKTRKTTGINRMEGVMLTFCDSIISILYDINLQYIDSVSDPNRTHKLTTQSRTTKYLTREL